MWWRLGAKQQGTQENKSLVIAAEIWLADFPRNRKQRWPITMCELTLSQPDHMHVLRLKSNSTVLSTLFFFAHRCLQIMSDQLCLLFTKSKQEQLRKLQRLASAYANNRLFPWSVVQLIGARLWKNNQVLKAPQSSQKKSTTKMKWVAFFFHNE